MASKRLLKKTINAICFDVIDECFTIRELHTVKDEAVLPLLNDAINFRNKAISQISKKQTRKERRKALQALNKEAGEVTLSFIDRLNELV